MPNCHTPRKAASFATHAPALASTWLSEQGTALLDNLVGITPSDQIFATTEGVKQLAGSRVYDSPAWIDRDGPTPMPKRQMSETSRNLSAQISSVINGPEQSYLRQRFGSFYNWEDRMVMIRRRMLLPKRLD